MNLKNKQQNLVSKNKQLQKEKNLLLKTTEDKRIEAEQEIKALNESAKALAKLIEKLSDISKKVEIATSKKGRLPFVQHQIREKTTCRGL